MKKQSIKLRLTLCLYLLQDVQKYQNIEELEQFMLDHGEKIVDTLGSEVDRIEKGLKVSSAGVGVRSHRKRTL